MELSSRAGTWTQMERTERAIERQEPLALADEAVDQVRLRTVAPLIRGMVAIVVALYLGLAFRGLGGISFAAALTGALFALYGVWTVARSLVWAARLRA